MRTLISTGSEFERLAAYSRVVVEGDWVFVSGCTGFNYKTGAISDDPVEQARQTFRNIVWALEQAGSGIRDVVRARVYVTGRDMFERVVPVIHEHFAQIRPANTSVICELVDPRMKVEIEVTARKGGG
ncbi:MAG: RidA family protein [Alphaproteobacteria bacterium]|nr:RidA family protein [Alphaproteobacteria bacterium]